MAQMSVWQLCTATNVVWKGRAYPSFFHIEINNEAASEYKLSSADVDCHLTRPQSDRALQNTTKDITA